MFPPLSNIYSIQKNIKKYLWYDMKVSTKHNSVFTLKKFHHLHEIIHVRKRV